jgi:hypothetical protein
MKKVFLVLAVLFSINCFSQDSVKVSIAVQARDLGYIGSFVFNSNEFEELYDSIKVKFRVANPATGITTVNITGYTQDWFNVYTRLNNDATALKALCTKRLEALLRAVNQPYLTSKLDAIDAANINSYQLMGLVGRGKLRRN